MKHSHEAELLAQSNRVTLDLHDQLDDLMAGFSFWRDQKIASAELTTLDEFLIRWVEHNLREGS